MSENMQKQNDIKKTKEKFGKNLISHKTFQNFGREMGRERSMRCVSEMGEENFGKLVKLVNDFGGFESIRELNAIIYLNSKLRKDFNYNLEDFEFHSEKGGDNKEIEWDIVSLELDEMLITKASVTVTEKGKCFSETRLIDIDFADFKNSCLKLERRLWPAAALYLYADDYYHLKQVAERENISREVLSKYGFSINDVEIIEEFLQSK